MIDTDEQFVKSFYPFATIEKSSHLEPPYEIWTKPIEMDGEVDLIGIGHTSFLAWNDAVKHINKSIMEKLTQ